MISNNNIFKHKKSQSDVNGISMAIYRSSNITMIQLIKRAKYKSINKHVLISDFNSNEFSFCEILYMAKRSYRIICNRFNSRMNLASKIIKNQNPIYFARIEGHYCVRYIYTFGG